MRSGLAQIVVFATAGLLAGQVPIHAQQADATVIPEVQDQSYCSRSSPSRAVQSSGTEVSIDNVTFSGFLQMPISDQDEIATSIRQETHGDALDRVIEEALDRVRAGWQNRGYFKVTVSGDTRTLTENAADLHIALFVHVDEGLRYTLGAITFKHDKAISNVEALRALFPINDGEIFSREKIAKGLEVLRKAYGQLGYINFTSVPNTTFDDQKKLIFLEIDVDEGKQFYVSSIDIVGADAEVLNDLALTPGQAYDVRLIRAILAKAPTRSRRERSEHPAPPVRRTKRDGGAYIRFPKLPRLNRLDVLGRW